MLDAADAEGLRRLDDQHLTGGLLRVHIRELIVIHEVTVLHRLIAERILLLQLPEGLHARLRLLLVAPVLREDDDIALITDMLHEAERDRVADTAIEERLPTDHDRLRHERHGGTRAEPLHLLRIRGLTLMINRSAGIAVRRDDIELHRICEEGIPVEEIERLWKRMVAELGIVEVSGLQQGLDAAVAPILREALIVADRASDLP